jgi:DNA invertase Pin-like site-specific DNA recombinase
MRTLPVPIPAAQYLRMSTDMQECSIESQAVVIQRYAEANGFKILKTYEDAGKSGLTISQRKGLQSLLSDVLQHKAVFRAVLVYDVSRWGRFQDADEAAHYEFLCKSSGVKVYYCAEQFGPEETLPARIMKALKRTMAAEFSRELSQRVFIGKQRRALKGFHQGSNPGYALRRVLVGADGHVKQVLQSGELKSISSDHVELVPGPERERKWVRWIYEQRIRGVAACDIIKELVSTRTRRREKHTHGPFTPSLSHLERCPTQDCAEGSEVSLHKMPQSGHSQSIFWPESCQARRCVGDSQRCAYDDRLLVL